MACKRFVGSIPIASTRFPDLEWLTVNAMKSAFAPFDERLDLIAHTVKPGFAAARAVTMPA